MKKKGNRIGKKLIGLLVAFFILIIVLLFVGSYVTHTREVDELQRSKVEQLSVLSSSLLDGDYLARLSETAASPEYQLLREKAEAEDNLTILEEYLEEQGLYEDYVRYTELLFTLQNDSKVEYVYVQDVGKEDAMYLLDPSESLYSLGYHEKNAEGLDDLTDNVRVPATVTKSEYGWLCTCAEPVIASDGTNTALVCVDLNMDDIMHRRQRFAVIMILESAIVLILMVLLGSFYIRKVISEPIRNLADEASAFGANGDDDLESQVVEIPSRKQKDEISDLYEDIRKMELGIIRYMKNLTAITEEKERISTELNIATRIQASMLPNVFPAFPEHSEFDIYALMQPAKSVAGDFYDFFMIDNDHLGIVMADVSGKGVPASLFMMASRIIINNIAQPGRSPHEILEMANDRICMNNDEEMFVTVWLGIINIFTGHVIAANAGHEYPVLQDEDGVYQLFRDRHGFVVGGMPGIRYKDYEFELKPGQTLFLYTDGVPEATTANDEQFGADRMIEALNKKKDAAPEELIRHMLRTVCDFDGDYPQFDDITMLAFRYQGTGKQNETDHDVPLNEED